MYRPRVRQGSPMMLLGSPGVPRDLSRVPLRSPPLLPSACRPLNAYKINVICNIPRVRKRGPWASFGVPLGVLELPRGRPWGSIGGPWVPPGRPWGSLRRPWAPSGCPRGGLGASLGRPGGVLSSTSTPSVCRGDPRDATGPKTTPKRSRSDPKMTPNRPQNDPKTTPKLPRQLPNMSSK